jgi:16S rRNA pseudouridine516 synthase
MRLDRFLVRRGTRSSREVAALLAAGQVRVDGETQIRGTLEINRFSRIELGAEILQSRAALHFLLHKPAGWLSATSDPLHPTVIDLIDHPLRHELHLAGRLDRATTGLVLLTNDGRWSKRVTEPARKIPKVYRVATRDDISPETAAIFAAGLYFAWEDLTTRPAELEILAAREALLTIHEGRYHQVKRMFHAVGNQVVGLHRERIGPLDLEGVPAGKSRPLTAAEIGWFHRDGSA